MKQSNYCYLIPCFNHGGKIKKVIETFLSIFEAHVFIIDDGSFDDTKKVLNLLDQNPNITLLSLSSNQGKGAAVSFGMFEAQKLGFTHAIQIDADGQHDLNSLISLIDKSREFPDSLVSGRPIYDEFVPKGRLIGRYITHFWVWVETLSFEIEDSMCGFRVYPIDASCDIFQTCSIGKRMDFDTDIMVRLFWNDCDVKFIETKVYYPEDGISHFDMVKDNIKITKMHTQLFFSMLPKIPKLLTRKKRIKENQNKHWSEKEELGSNLGINLLVFIRKFCGKFLFDQILKIVIFYYRYISKSRARVSKQYLDNYKSFAKKQNITIDPKLTVFNHFFSFAQMMLDKIFAFQGNFNHQDVELHGKSLVDELIANKEGALLIGSHLGNLELTRALVKYGDKVKINIIASTENSQKFRSVIDNRNENTSFEMIPVENFNAATIIIIDQKINNGEWVVCMADRTSITQEGKVVWCDFLGKKAPFPQGAFILASVLKVKTYLIFGLVDNLNKNAKANLYFEHFSDEIKLNRKTREKDLQTIVQKFATRLEYYTLRFPLQWFNFFDFWNLAKDIKVDKNEK